MNKQLIALCAGGILLSSTAVMAQGALTGVTGVDDQIDTITENVADELDKGNDDARFGFTGVRQGWGGSFALSTSAASGNSDAVDLSLGGRLTYGAGSWSHYLGFGADYGKSGGVVGSNEFFATYEATYELSNSFYVFGTGRYQFDDLNSPRQDAFIGFGPGYRIINTPETAWRVQAGIGGRFTQEAVTLTETTDVAYIASSRFFHKFSDTMSLTNDTDVLNSDTGTIATNDLGLNFRMTDLMSTRLSLKTDFNSDPAATFDKVDNTVGAAIVFSF
jgi:putative salt-induced outer membrane protein